MTPRRASTTLSALVAVALLAGCASAGKLRETSSVLRADVEKAKRSGAARCAPRELALAETNVDFADHEIAYGDPVRAREHLSKAEYNVHKALEMSQTCAPTQVTIAKDKGPVRIEKTDADKDGVPDVDDRCPEVPGRADLAGCPDADGDGVTDAEDRCPREPGTVEDGGCPVAKDTDADGIPDDIDRCALDPEDKDGFQDEDGCPDADNDADGVVDRSDACPLEAGPIENRGCPVADRDRDGVLDKDDRCPDAAGLPANGGCPDGDKDGDTVTDSRDKCPAQFGPPPDGCPRKYRYLEVTREAIKLKQPIVFANAKARILPASNKVMRELALAMSDYPKMRIRIEGHTDNAGKAASNLKLSQRRAEAVLDDLAAKGVAPDRMEAAGFGSTKPVASNKTKTGRQKNRRIDLKILSME